MDDGTDWTASALFSPSKARAHQAQAKDWASVDAWLAKKYASKKLPPFERNEETLQALLTLATLNDGADEQRGHIDRIEKAVLSAHAKRSSTTDKSYESWIAKFEPTDDLSSLADAVVSLECPEASVLAVAEGLAELSSKNFTLHQQVQLIEAQLNMLQSEQHRVTQILTELGQESLRSASDLLEHTGEWTRSAKHMKAKIVEYDERLSGTRSSQPTQTRFEDVLREQQDLRAQTEHLAEVNAELKAFQSIPADARAARAKIEKSRGELRDLMIERDGLFERLAENG